MKNAGGEQAEQANQVSIIKIAVNYTTPKNMIK